MEKLCGQGDEYAKGNRVADDEFVIQSLIPEAVGGAGGNPCTRYEQG